MRIGYSCWGFLGPGVMDTPDGSRSYRRSFIDGLIAAGQEIVLLQANRDLEEAGLDLRDRYRWDGKLPELDAIIFEWRWPLPGRNTTPCGSPGHTCDLHRQDQLVEHYTIRFGLPTLLWDLDRQLAVDDPIRSLPNVAVCEFGISPGPGVHTLLCPVPDELLDRVDPVALARADRPVPLVYVGNQYDRDEAFNQYFAPAAARLSHRVAGKWPRTERWPGLNFTGRAPFSEVESIHHGAVATVLLLPERYAAVGHMSSRWFEALLAGCLPITPADIAHAERFTPPALHVRDSDEVVERLGWFTGVAGSREHGELIASCLPFLDQSRTSRQVARACQLLENLSNRTS
ncbi:hypothetical protein JQS43_15035 [Natronosporangium hydrolyticum]|uniref:Uncharacterized protein n=1 Tax=Natronosporangium hydrolyticum TaxID=2811111 RepID=A0A895YC04_9ACTN|nr:glycosyltransferase [Natronosporangium hydrolyticum]QSB12973.1 hypothetical protein JQS43_15035 [Natronosporangium hydrolyticum]